MTVTKKRIKAMAFVQNRKLVESIFAECGFSKYQRNEGLIYFSMYPGQCSTNEAIAEISVDRRVLTVWYEMSIQKPRRIVFPAGSAGSDPFQFKLDETADMVKTAEKLRYILMTIREGWTALNVTLNKLKIIYESLDYANSTD